MGNSESAPPDDKSLFSFTVLDLDNQSISLSNLKGKKFYVVVNVASC